MNISVENVSSVKKRLSVEVPEALVSAEIEKAYVKIGKNAKVKGFRPGKIPRPLLEQYYAPQMEEQVVNRLVNESYRKALLDHDIDAVAPLKLVENSPLESGKPFTYAAEVEVKPVVTVRDYAGLAVKKERYVFADRVVDERLEELRQSRGRIVASTRETAAGGDFVSIDFAGSIDGVPFEGGAAADFQLELGSGQFIPGFEDQVVGMKVGESRDVTVTFPENYGKAELAGKPAVFAVTLKEIREKVAPALDDEFAKGFGLGSMAELRDKLAEMHQSQEARRIEGDLRERLVAALIERNPIEVPEALIENQLDHMLDNIRRRLESQGMKLEMMGISDASFRTMYRDTAVSQVQGVLLLEAVAKQESITVDAAEIDGRLEEIAAMSNAPVDAVRKYYGREEARDGLIAQIVEEKSLRFLLDKAVVTEVDAAELQPAAAE